MASPTRNSCTPGGATSTRTACAADSKKFGAWDQNLMTEWHIRYGGHGVMICWHVERKSACIYSQLKRWSSYEVAAMIEGVLQPGGWIDQLWPSCTAMWSLGRSCDNGSRSPCTASGSRFQRGRLPTRQSTACQPPNDFRTNVTHLHRAEQPHQPARAVVLERPQRFAMAARATAATVRVDLRRDQDALQTGQGCLALVQAQPERRRLTGPGALTLRDHVLRHRAALARHLHLVSPLHRTPERCHTSAPYHPPPGLRRSPMGGVARGKASSVRSNRFRSAA